MSYRGYAYYKDYRTRRRQEMYERAVEFLGGECFDCGAVENLQFDHKKKSNKVCAVSSMLTCYSWKRILVEVRKCVLRCPDCHVRRHGGEPKSPPYELLSEE